MSYVGPNPPPYPPPPPGFLAECVIVCDRYHDFLGKTLPHNKYLFDRIVVVTSAEDLQTQRICEFYHVECVPTDALKSRWKQFCKGCGINEGLARLAKDGWVVHLDADILLPPLTRHLLEQADLDPAMLYGIDRFNVRGYDAWANHVDMPQLQQEDGAYVHLGAFPLGTRVTAADAGGYVPIGFFQMWNPRTSGVTSYPEGHTDAGRSDMIFAKQWPRSKRALLPELIGYHLESDDASMSANWQGRKTAPFTQSGDPARLR